MRISDWSSDVCSSDLRGHAEMNTAAFDTLSFTKRLEEAGLNRKVAEALSLAVQEVAMQNVATKADVEQAVHTMTIRGMSGLVAAVEIGRATCRERVCQYV